MSSLAQAILYPHPEIFEKIILSVAFIATIIIHLAVISVMVMTNDVDESFSSLPTIRADFAYYDPKGGIGGASDNDVIMEETFLPAQAEVLSRPETEPEPETDETSAVIESTSPKAAPKPKNIPVNENKTKEKSKDTQQAQAFRSGSVEAFGDSQTAGGNDESGRGGTGGGQGRGNPNLLNAYMSQIQRKLSLYKKYPPEAKSQGMVGQVKVNFTVDRQGQVISSRLVQSSGYSALDNEALALLKRVSPVPAIPPELNRNNLNMTVPVVFSLK
ncbi:MAG: energy transducer TonB [Deltaproteobacteria bacterium]|jgi:protein TonB|nr:energy transducer TonB [Deltaproteobacteria bacterium]